MAGNAYACEGRHIMALFGLGARRMQSREGEDARGEAVRGDERRRVGRAGDGATAFTVNVYSH